jgi:hypothetical protein
MASKKEYKRTVKKLKERVEKAPEKVMVRPKRLKKVAKSINEAKEILKRGRLELKGAREPISSKEFEQKRKAGKIERREYAVDVPKPGEPPEKLKMTNGVEAPTGLIALISHVKDLKVAKAIARAATRRVNRLKAFEEIDLCRTFAVGDDVWWTKKGFVHSGKVIRLKTRKLVVKDSAEPDKEVWVLPVRKVKRGPVPKEHLHPDPKRWAIGRAGGRNESKRGESVASCQA